ncbi:MAG: SusC/RagA family TonB-linked outer membrane protein [Cyclobacteriaceae bacterium]
MLQFKRILSIFFILFCYSTQAQTITVRGRVTSSDDGSPLPGVNVIEKGTQNGTRTDQDGNYLLSVASSSKLVYSFVGYKSQEVNVATASSFDVVLQLDALTHWPVLNVGYGAITSNVSTGVNDRLTDDNFNRGNIYDPAQLWQGRVAGLSIYNRGWDPNSDALMRIRGLSTFDTEATPLIVIDGVPMATLHNLDPQDIQSIHVLKDGAASAIYGMRGSQGVIIITTKRGSPARGLAVTLQSETAAAILAKKQPVMTASEHIAAGANDLGASTDWQDEITRTGISTSHHLAISGAHGTSSFRVATHVRHVEGILLNSGFDQVNTRANLNHQALDSRLRFDFNLSVSNRKSNFSFPIAFRYANLFSPSAPVYFSNGDYYQAILFDNYNPVAILEQNVNLGRRRNTNYGARVDFDILENLTVTANIAQQFENNFNGRYISRNSLFGGGVNRGGLANRFTDDRAFTLAEAYLTYNLGGDKTNWTLVGGFSYQEDQSESFGAELGNFPSDELGYNAIGYSADVLAGLPNLIDLASTTSPVNTITAGFVRATVNLNEVVSFNLSLRHEQSNKLGANGQSGVFPAAGANINVASLIPGLALPRLNMRLGYGVTGSVPTQYGLANDRFDYLLSGGGMLVKVRDGNANLKWERKNETNLGFDFGGSRLSGSLDFYQRNISDIILQRSVDPLIYSSGTRFENAAALKGGGLELSLSYFAGAWDGLSWRPSIVLSTNRSTLESYPVSQELRGYPDGPCGCSTTFVKLGVGDQVGNFWGPVYEGVGSNGAPVFKDVNGDNQVLTNPGMGLDPTSDFAVLGKAFPSWELGISNSLTFRNWQLDAFFRGAFGHSLMNSLRLGYEVIDLGALNSYNRVQTDKAVDGLTAGFYSSLYVEKASFLMLDNVTLTYTLPSKSGSWLRWLKVFGTIQNAFTVTSYSGVNPEPSLIDHLPPGSYNIPADVLTPGIDRNSGYAPARTFKIGVAAGI